MRKGIKNVISFGYKVSSGDHEGFALFLRKLKHKEAYEEKWRKVVVDVITELPARKCKKVLDAFLKSPVH